MAEQEATPPSRPRLGSTSAPVVVFITIDALRGDVLLDPSRDEAWPTTLVSDGAEFALLQLANLYGYAWWSLVARPTRWQRWWRKASSGHRLRGVA